MTPEEQQKTLDRLAKTLELAYNRPGKIFWHGLLWGLGRGLGATLGLAIVLAVSFFFLRATGLEDTVKNSLRALEDISNSLRNQR